MIPLIFLYPIVAGALGGKARVGSPAGESPEISL